MRFWWLFHVFRQLPTDKPSLEKWLTLTGAEQPPDIPPLDYERLSLWFGRILEEEKEEAVLLPAAARFPGAQSARILERLSTQEGMTGALAALLFAGRKPQHSATGRPFNGPWLESWAQKATAGHIKSVVLIFSVKPLPNDRGRSNVSPDNLTLDVPNVVSGVFARQRSGDVSLFLKEKFWNETETEFNSFLHTLKNYDPQDPGSNLNSAKAAVKYSVFWNAEKEGELKAISAPHPETRQILDQALVNLRKNKSRSSPFPTGDELQTILTPP